MLNSAKLRHVIDIEKKVQSQDPISGEISVTWEAAHRNIRASIEPLSVRDFIAAKSGQSKISVRIMIRYIPDLDETMRIVGRCACHKKIYNPEGWLEDAESGMEYITAPCSTGVNSG